MFPTAKMITDIDSLKVNKAGDTMTGALTITGDLTVDTSTLKVDSANNRVGIGTSTPNGTLHILNSSAGTTPSNYLRIEGSVANNSNYPGIELKGGTLSDGGYPNITLTNGGLAIILQSGFGASSNQQRNQISLNASSGITFLTSTSGTATERMRIDSAGNVGIGTGSSNPSCRLQVTATNSTNANNTLTGSFVNIGSSLASGFGIRQKGDDVGISGETFPLQLATIGNIPFEIYTADSQPLVLGTNATERMRITSAGVLQLSQGQIKFPATQVASADPNTLDDYEEGTFDAGIAFNGLSTDGTYSNRQCRYTKIGRVVHISGQITLSLKPTPAGNATITGLPFVVANENGGYSSPSIYVSAVTFADYVQGFANPNTQTISLREVTNAGVVSFLTDADFANNSEIIFSCTYSV
jgi:hypothetical protein